MKGIRNVLIVIFILCFTYPGAAGEGFHHTRFVIDQIPEQTPHDAALFLASNINGWTTDAPGMKFRKEGGKWALIVHHTQDTIYYKITRGNWESVEAGKNGRARPNRIFVAAFPQQEVHLTIDSWEDTSFPSYSVYVIFLIASAIQGFLLIIAINTLSHQNHPANSILSILLGILTLSLLGRAFTFNPAIFNSFPKLILVPEIILFTYAPIFYLYIRKVLSGIGWRKKDLFQFIPFGIQGVAYLPFLMVNDQSFIFAVIDLKLFPYFAWSGVFSLCFNMIYWVACWRLFVRHFRSPHLNDRQRKYTRFLGWILRIKIGYLFLWFLLVVIYVTGRITGRDLLFISENLTDILWVLFSLLIFAMGFFAVRQPELLRERKPYKDQVLPAPEFDAVVTALSKLLVQEKVFIQKDLTLERLAHMIPTGSHTLSRVINERYQKNFTELINTYRVEAFVKKIKEHKKVGSFLEIAFSVGFNSKPTFNRAFKKLKGKTPRAYFNEDHKLMAH